MNKPIANRFMDEKLKRTVLVGIGLVLAVTAVTQVNPPVAQADRYDDQIRAVQREINRYQAEAQKLKDQANTIEKELAQLTADMNVIQGQVDLSQAQYDKLQQQIIATEKKIDSNRKALGNIISDMYVDSEISPLEMLASSKNIADYVDRSAYQASISENLKNMIGEVKKAKDELESQQQAVNRVLGEQKLAKDQLAEKTTERQTLLDKTKGDQAAYTSLVANREQQKGELHREQQAAIEAAMRRGSGGAFSPSTIGDSSKGGYPWEAGCWVNANAWSYGGVNGNGTDPLGYGCRQCVSYTAFKVGQRTGNYPRYWGNANMWPASARSAGYQTGSTPRANSVGIIMAGQYGHSVWIDEVNGDGTLTISQYNYYNAGGQGWGHYSKMRVSASTYDVFIYF